jgi:hypothetical protein
MEALGCQKIPPLEYFISLATDKHALQEFKDLPAIDVPDNPEMSLPYPEGNIDNVYSDLDLVTKFTPTANPEDEASQSSLHKKSVVDQYDSSVFEPALGGKRKNKKTRKNRK